MPTLEDLRVTAGAATVAAPAPEDDAARLERAARLCADMLTGPGRALAVRAYTRTLLAMIRDGLRPVRAEYVRGDAYHGVATVPCADGGLYDREAVDDLLALVQEVAG
jgi:hypothetical protein